MTTPRPIDHALRNLRHAYEQLAAGTVRDQAEFARGLLAPAIRAIEPFGESAAAAGVPATGEALRDLVIAYGAAEYDCGADLGADGDPPRLQRRHVAQQALLAAIGAELRA